MERDAHVATQDRITMNGSSKLPHRQASFGDRERDYQEYKYNETTVKHL
jgi:hypothetical protein